MIEMISHKLSFASRAYPVFVTSLDVAPELVDSFLRELAKRNGNERGEDYFAEYYLVTKTSLPAKHRIDEACVNEIQWPTTVAESSGTPFPDFKPVPEFLDASTEKLDKVFKMYFDISPFARHSYIVLDARSVEDGITCLIRNIDSNTGPARARCVFKLASEILIGPESGLGYNFNDFREKGPKFRDPWGLELYYYHDGNFRKGGP